MTAPKRYLELEGKVRLDAVPDRQRIYQSLEIAAYVNHSDIEVEFHGADDANVTVIAAPAAPVPDGDMLRRLKRWYLRQCDGECEHSFGVEIGTLDNPGWSLKVDLTDTPRALSSPPWSSARGPGTRPGSTSSPTRRRMPSGLRAVARRAAAG